MAKYSVGQLVEMKKGHPCGANCWRIIRVGMDVRIKCLNCGRSVLIPRSRFERRLKKIISEGEQQKE
ncbi:MAG: DUF951 domain-containing protein [Bacillota bacterium]|nr:DUF951 domain-containing protein [Bacillota bacterium]